MLKRRLWAALYLLTASLTLTALLTAPAQAQDAPQPTEDPIVAEAVATLIAQTQQAQPQMNMTQTIQAALEAALTATAQAPTATPDATTVLPTIDVDGLEVTNVTELELIAGATNRAAYLAPDGEKFVYFTPIELCLYEENTLTRCVELEERVRSVDPESLRWSPDSRYVAFNEDFFRLYIDPDIWVWDTTTETLTNLTEDDTSRVSIMDDSWDNVDIAPTWTDEGNIVFARYRFDRSVDDVIPPDIYQIAPDGSNLTRLGSFDVEHPYSVLSMETRGNQIMYVYFSTRRDDRHNGVWTSNRDGSAAEQIAETNGEVILLTASLSADGRYLLIHTPPSNVTGMHPEESSMRLVEVESGRMLLIDPEHFVSAAGWSPAGSTLVYAVYNMGDTANNGLYVTDTPGKAGRLLLEGDFLVPTPRQSLPLVWGANNTVLVTSRDDLHVRLIELAE